MLLSGTLAPATPPRPVSPGSTGSHSDSGSDSDSDSGSGSDSGSDSGSGSDSDSGSSAMSDLYHSDSENIMQFNTYCHAGDLAKVREASGRLTAEERAVVREQFTPLYHLLGKCSKVGDLSLLEYLYNTILDDEWREGLSSGDLDDEGGNDNLPVWEAVKGNHPESITFWYDKISNHRKADLFRLALTREQPDMAKRFWALMTAEAKKDCVENDIREWEDYEQDIFDGTIKFKLNEIMEDIYDLASHDTKLFFTRTDRDGHNSSLNTAAEYKNREALQFVWQQLGLEQKRIIMTSDFNSDLEAYFPRAATRQMMRDVLSLLPEDSEKKETFFRLHLDHRRGALARLCWEAMTPTQKRSCVGKEVVIQGDDETIFAAAIRCGLPDVMKEIFELADPELSVIFLSASTPLGVLELAAEKEDAKTLEFIWHASSAAQKHRYVASTQFYRVVAFMARAGLDELLQEGLSLIAPAPGDQDAVMEDAAATAPNPLASMATAHPSATSASGFGALVKCVDYFYGLHPDDRLALNHNRPRQMEAADEATKELYRQRFNHFLLSLKGIGFPYWHSETLAYIPDAYSRLLFTLHRCFDETADHKMTQVQSLEPFSKAVRDNLQKLIKGKQLGLNYYSVAAMSRYDHLKAVSKAGAFNLLPDDVLIEICNAPDRTFPKHGAPPKRVQTGTVGVKRSHATSQTVQPTHGVLDPAFDSSSETVEQRAAKRGHY